MGDRASPGLHVEIQHAKISATVNQSGPDAVLDVGAESDHVIVNIKLGSDSFLSAVLPPSLRLDSKIGLGVNTQTGFYLNGGVALVVDLPVNLTLDAGGIIGMTLQALHLRIGFTEPDQQTTIRTAPRSPSGSPSTPRSRSPAECSRRRWRGLAWPSPSSS